MLKLRRRPKPPKVRLKPLMLRIHPHAVGPHDLDRALVEAYVRHSRRGLR